MYISHRMTIVRNSAIAMINGSITLIILLIAPLGLAAVIGNTFLVTVASFFTATFADQVIWYLQPSRRNTSDIPLDQSHTNPTQKIHQRDLEKLDGD